MRNTLKLVWCIFWSVCLNNHLIITDENHLIVFYIDSSKNFHNNYSQRKFFNNKAFEILKKSDNNFATREMLFKVAYNYLLLNDFENLRRATEHIYKQSIYKKSQIHIAKASAYLGIYYENKSKNDSAFYFYLKAEKIYNKNNDYRHLCKIYQNIAKIKYFENDYLGSENSLIKALKISRNLNLFDQQYQINLLLGINSLDLGNFDDAFKYYLKALGIATNNDIKNKIAIPECNYYIGLAYFYKGDLKKGIFYFNRGLETKKLLESDPALYCSLMDELAYTCIKTRRLSRLPNLLNYTKSIRDSFNINTRSNFNRLYLSEYYHAIEDTVKATLYANEALKLSREFHAPNDILLSLKQLSKVNPKHALEYSEEYITISDSIQKRERLTRNKFAKIAYETEEITHEKDLAVKQKSIFIFTTIGMFLLGLMLVILLVQRHKHKKLQFRQIEQKKDEEIYQLIENQQSKLDEGRSLEKSRIAQDLHDGIMNKLSSIRLNLFVLNTKTDPQTIQSCIPYINRIQEVEKEVRNISHDLNNDVFSGDEGFKNILISLFEEQKKVLKAKWHIEIDQDIKWDQIKTNKKIHLYRVIQEILQNIYKHAKAENIIASMSVKQQSLFFEIYDDGIGFSLKGTKKGIGLYNISSRIAACFGTLNIHTDKGSGTTIAITIPLDI